MFICVFCCHLLHYSSCFCYLINFLLLVVTFCYLFCIFLCTAFFFYIFLFLFVTIFASYSLIVNIYIYHSLFFCYILFFMKLCFFMHCYIVLFIISVINCHVLVTKFCYSLRIYIHVCALANARLYVFVYVCVCVYVYTCASPFPTPPRTVSDHRESSEHPNRIKRPIFDKGTDDEVHYRWLIFALVFISYIK